jgi:hypothetical protein
VTRPQPPRRRPPARLRTACIRLRSAREPHQPALRQPHRGRETTDGRPEGPAACVSRGLRTMRHLRGHAAGRARKTACRPRCGPRATRERAGGSSAARVVAVQRRRLFSVALRSALRRGRLAALRSASTRHASSAPWTGRGVLVGGVPDETRRPLFYTRTLLPAPCALTRASACASRPLRSLVAP